MRTSFTNSVSDMASRRVGCSVSTQAGVTDHSTLRPTGHSATMANCSNRIASATKFGRRTPAEVDTLADTLTAAIKKDVQTIGSPVYSLVDGLRPADISGVRTQRATYFNNIADDWSQRIAVARTNGYPEDILTLANDVQTPLHRRKLLRNVPRR